jgi:hypothetical protein
MFTHRHQGLQAPGIYQHRQDMCTSGQHEAWTRCEQHRPDDIRVIIPE